ncbi:hypothetical protein [Spirosoma montaniterrae]|uniref:Monoheme cytochrome C n=1 Tax=Spirosoma montaniterrae TaxID=1178516 RepID=A0A1P9WX42_9BACT|nr:hypothetical protein [Spirosoma montaniterrae]AQG79913.1 hypothetical protein AWR27_11605 [Spirosoma montaniterrae]
MKPIQLLALTAVLFVALVGFRTGKRPAPNGWATVADTLKVDAETGLVDDTNLMLVKAQCTACHSSKLILQHRFTRDGWQERIRWMQKYHKLWDLGESEKVVLDYLEKYYGPQTARFSNTLRRAPLKNVQWYQLEQ